MGKKSFFGSTLYFISWIIIFFLEFKTNSTDINYKLCKERITERDTKQLF